MKRVLVLGPGPVRPGVGPAASTIASDLADALSASGLEVAVLDSSPASALLWPDAPRRRWLEPLDAPTLRRVAEIERVDAIVAVAAGPFVLRALTAEGDAGTKWLGASPSELVAAKRAMPSSLEGGDVIDVVAASDGTSCEVIAAFACAEPAFVALGDGGHRFVADPPAALREVVAARFSGARFVGIETLRCVDRDGRLEVVAVDPVDTALWTAAGLARGIRPGTLLGRLVIGDALADALRAAAAPVARVTSRVPSFDFDPFPGVDRTLGASPKSLGGTLVAEASGGAKQAAERRVVVVGPGPVRAGHGAEASAAVRLAAREASRLGCEVVVVTAREGTGAERYAARVHITSDAAKAIADEAPAAVLLGFGADPQHVASLGRSGATDVTASFFAKARALEAAPPAPDATEIHVVALSDGTHAKVLGTFEHVERASVHPEDAAAVFPSLAVEEPMLRAAEERALAFASEAGVRGLLTVHFAVPRTGRPEPAAVAMIGATAGVTTHVLSLGLANGADPVAEAVRVALGGPLDPVALPQPRHVAVEEHVFPFAALGASDTRLDRRPRGTGSVLALGETVARAYARALAAMGVSLRRPGAGGERAVLLAGAEEHAVDLADVGRRFYALGFEIVATEASAVWLRRARVPHRTTSDAEGLVSRRGVVAAVATEGGAKGLRHAALVAGVTCFGTVELVKVAVRALELEDPLSDLRCLEDWASR